VLDLIGVKQDHLAVTTQKAYVNLADDAESASSISQIYVSRVEFD